MIIKYIHWVQNILVTNKNILKKSLDLSISPWVGLVTDLHLVLKTVTKLLFSYFST